MVKRNGVLWKNINLEKIKMLVRAARTKFTVWNFQIMFRLFVQIFLFILFVRTIIVMSKLIQTELNTEVSAEHLSLFSSDVVT